MGLVLPQTVKVKIASLNYKYYREKGYEFEKRGDIIEVNVLDLHPGSPIKVKIICDVCGKEAEMRYYRVIEYNKENKLIICGDKICKCKKVEDTNLKKYGVKSTNQLKTVKDKKINTCRKNHGVDNPSQSQEIKSKKIDTCRKHFGVDNPAQSQEIQNKMKDTNLGRYGTENAAKSEIIKNKMKATWQKNYGEDIENPFQVESVKEKSKQTMLKNHGVEHALQNRELLNKALDSFQFNGTGPCSRQQKYIHFLIGGTLNKRVCNSLVDIYMEKENIVIEHDGSGHFLTDKFNGNKTLSKEALLKEKNREDKIISNGYRIIRFIATKDRIPSDEVILNLIEGFKNLDFKVIRINFEEGTIDRDYEEKWYCNFGELRRITKEDLEQFESKK